MNQTVNYIDSGNFSSQKYFKFVEPSNPCIFLNNLLFFDEIGVVLDPLNRVINNVNVVKMCKKISFTKNLLKIIPGSFFVELQFKN